MRRFTAFLIVLVAAVAGFLVLRQDQRSDAGGSDAKSEDSATHHGNPPNTKTGDNPLPEQASVPGPSEPIFKGIPVELLGLIEATSRNCDHGGHPDHYGDWLPFSGELEAELKRAIIENPELVDDLIAFLGRSDVPNHDRQVLAANLPFDATVNAALEKAVLADPSFETLSLFALAIGALYGGETWSFDPVLRTKESLAVIRRAARNSSDLADIARFVTVAGRHVSQDPDTEKFVLEVVHGRNAEAIETREIASYYLGLFQEDRHLKVLRDGILNPVSSDIDRKIYLHGLDSILTSPFKKELGKPYFLSLRASFLEALSASILRGVDSQRSQYERHSGMVLSSWNDPDALPLYFELMRGKVTYRWASVQIRKYKGDSIASSRLAQFVLDQSNPPNARTSGVVALCHVDPDTAVQVWGKVDTNTFPSAERAILEDHRRSFFRKFNRKKSKNPPKKKP